MQYDMSEIMRFAQSSAGQQLIAFLQKNGGNDLKEAVSMASAGNFDKAKQSLSSLLETEEMKKLMKQLEEET